MGPTGTPLFTVPFTSPTRSGIHYFAVGLNWAPVNQQRDWSKPTWALGVEGRFGVGDPLHACDATGGGTPRCPDPAGTGAQRTPGMSRAMYSLDARTVISRRFGYVEPYTGIDALFEFPRSDSDFGTTNARGVLVSTPPIVGTFTIGLEVIPWERREQFQRLVFDVRVQGIYNSPGREYSELFDALGSTTAPTLRNPNPGGWMPDPANPTGGSVADPNSQKVYFTGITDQAGYGAFAAQASVTWMAGEYVKFNLGGGVRVNQAHVITAADPCNPNVTSDITTSGPCRTIGTPPQATGVPDPNYRAVLDTPGRRFSVDNTVIGQLMLSGTVMF